MLPSDNEYRITAEALLANTSGYHSNQSSTQGVPQNEYCKHYFNIPLVHIVHFTSLILG